MARRVLHLLSQRPGRTGSGVTLRALAREAAAAGWEQAVALGTPASDPAPVVDGVPSDHVHPLCFGPPPLDFPLPGMSDVMPYASSRWQDLTPAQLGAYRAAWRAHVAPLLERFRPDVIHAHHLWLLTALARDLAPDLPLVVHAHATGLRQRELCPHLADEVRAGVARANLVLVLTHEMGRRVEAALGVDASRVEVVGAGYRDDLFDARGIQRSSPGAVLYVGKVSRAKGLPWLLDAFERVAARNDRAVLHVAGSGEGAEADALRARMEALAPRVLLHGHLEQPDLADLMRRCRLFVLPSFYEGLPLVLVEAVAAGLDAVCTDLVPVREDLAPHLGAALELVEPPRLRGVDEPVEEDLPGFVERLEQAIERGLRPGPEGAIARPDLGRVYSWRAVFRRVERAWEHAIRSRGNEVPPRRAGR